MRQWPRKKKIYAVVLVIALAALISLVALSAALPRPVSTSADDSWALAAYAEAGGEELTRGSMAMALCALSGDKLTEISDISDVSSSACYCSGAVWAVSRGVMSLYEDNAFHPHEEVSRQDMACALRRFAALCGFDTTAIADLSAFADSGAVDAAALASVRWAVGAGLLSGVSPTELAPTDTASCAQLTAALLRLYSGRRTEPSRAAIVRLTAEAAESYAANVQKLSFLSVGDNLYHEPVIQSGLSAGGSYDFSDIYSEIAPYVQSADIASINQETMFVSDPAQYSGYPTFGTPFEVAGALEKTGFDLVTQASNHALDKGVQSILDAVRYWRTNYPNMTVLGIRDEAKSRVTLVEKNGVTIAMLCYCYGLNGLTLPSGDEYLIDQLTLGADAIAADMREAEQSADCTIVFMHAGTEYVYTPDATQTYWAQFFADHGAEVIIGTHPHVLEPLVYLQTADGRRVPCYYSLGNLVSNQQEYPRWLGGMATFDIVVDGGEVCIENVLLRPTFTHIYLENGISNYRAYLLSDYTPALAAQHQYASMFGASTETIWELYDEITGGE